MTLHYITPHQRRINSAISAVLGGILVFLGHVWAFQLSDAHAEPEPITHISIPADLFKVGRGVCVKNGGLLNIVIEPELDTFTFRCKDGLSLKDSIVRIKA